MSLSQRLPIDCQTVQLQELAPRRAANTMIQEGTGIGESLPGSANTSFRMFNRIISNLVESHQELEAKVARLTAELAAAKDNGQRELEEKERVAQQLSTLLTLLPAGVVVLDGQGRVQQCNPAAIDLLGEPLEGEPWLNVIQRSFAPREDDGHEVSLKDGRRVSIATRSMESEPGQLVLINDLTETRELQAQLSRHARLSSMGRMVASLAHQIRTPLSAAMLYAGHLSHPELAPQLRLKCAEKLMSRLVHLDQQVRDMLIFARGETRLAEKLSLADLVAQLQQAVEPSLQRSNTECHWSVPEQDVQILCNKEALIGALQNLVQNSIEAAKGGSAVSVRVNQTGGEHCSIEIIDQGVGFEPGQQPRIMEAFYTTKSQGTGLGLAVVQAVVKAHHGRFQLLSDGPGMGARAVITLPVFKLQVASPMVAA